MNSEIPIHAGVEKAPLRTLGHAHLKSVVESLVFAANEPLSLRRLVSLTRAPKEQIQAVLEELSDDYRDRGIDFACIGQGYQFRTAAINAPFVRDVIGVKTQKLSRTQLETLAICAYRQPITRPEIDAIRGVDSGAALKLLAERDLLRILGRKEEAGRPLLYGTTRYFLEFFALQSLKELPTLKEFSELNDESRALFERKMGEPMVSDADAQAVETEVDEPNHEDSSDVHVAS